MAIARSGPQRANVTHYNGVPGTFVNGKAQVVGSVVTGMQGTVAFGTAEAQHDSSLSALGASSAGEIELNFTGPYDVLDASAGGSKLWGVSCEVINATTVRFYKKGLAGNGNDPADLTATTHYFNARRRVMA